VEIEMPRGMVLLVVLAGVSTAGCRADREAIESGAGFETPPAVEEAPAMPIPPQPLPPRGTPTDTVLPPPDPDTLTAEDIRPPA
jgi:hypothetical protein